MAVRLSEDAKQQALASIKRFVSETLEEDIGDLKAALVLEFCLKEIGPSIYNQAIADAQTSIRDKVEDLDGTCYEPEFSYWKK